MNIFFFELQMFIMLNVCKCVSDFGVIVKYIFCVKIDEYIDEDNVEEEIVVIDKEKKLLLNDDYKNEKMVN